MPYAHVQTVSAGTATVTITPSTAGNLLILSMWWSGGHADPTVTAGFVSCGTSVESGSGYVLHQWYYENNSGGITSAGALSWSDGTPGSIRCTVSEYSGIATSSSFITHAAQAQTSPLDTGTDDMTSTAASVGTAPALIYGYINDAGTGTTMNAGTGFTSRGVDGDGGRIEDERITVTGSTAATFTAATNPVGPLVWMSAFAEPTASLPANQYPRAHAQRNRRSSGRYM